VHASVFFDLYACVHNDFETLAYQWCPKMEICWRV
jgi:hypothetical protein